MSIQKEKKKPLDPCHDKIDVFLRCMAQTETCDCTNNAKMKPS